jgi:hypothetical protein
LAFGCAEAGPDEKISRITSSFIQSPTESDHALVMACTRGQHRPSRRPAQRRVSALSDLVWRLTARCPFSLNGPFFCVVLGPSPGVVLGAGRHPTTPSRSAAEGIHVVASAQPRAARCPCPGSPDNHTSPHRRAAPIIPIARVPASRTHRTRCLLLLNRRLVLDTSIGILGHLRAAGAESRDPGTARLSTRSHF